ncbi:MAG: hypothetical protein ABIH24_11235 [Verrucomicrobiota bacterium]
MKKSPNGQIMFFVCHAEQSLAESKHLHINQLYMDWRFLASSVAPSVAQRAMEGGQGAMEGGHGAMAGKLLGMNTRFDSTNYFTASDAFRH